MRKALPFVMGLWLILTLVWIIASGWLLWDYLKADCSIARTLNDLDLIGACLLNDASENWIKPLWRLRLQTGKWVFLPPFVILILGYAVYWAAERFSTAKSK